MNADIEKRKLIVLILRHFDSEDRLIESMDQLATSSAETLARAGTRGPSKDDLQKLEPLMAELAQVSSTVNASRVTLIGRINQVHESDFTRVKHFIRTLDPHERNRLDARRRELVDRAYAAQSRLIQCQATLYYTFDFHRKYLAGVMNEDPQRASYSADGHGSNVNPGNIVRKAC